MILYYFLLSEDNTVEGGNWEEKLREMSFKIIVRELREMKDGIGNMSKRVGEGMQWRGLTRSQTAVVPDEASPSLIDPNHQSQWTNLPPELLLDILRRVEESETSWPARAVVVYCASVCRSWRDIIREIVKTPEQCGRLTFPISLKQVVLMNLCCFFVVLHTPLVILLSVCRL